MACIQTGARSCRLASADTTIADGRLMLTVLGGLVEFERELTHEATLRRQKRFETLARAAQLRQSASVHEVFTSRKSAGGFNACTQIFAKVSWSRSVTSYSSMIFGSLPTATTISS
jgi:hypothetical protein